MPDEDDLLNAGLNGEFEETEQETPEQEEVETPEQEELEAEGYTPNADLLDDTPTETESRGSKRFQELANQRAEATERAEKAEREAASYRERFELEARQRLEAQEAMLPEEERRQLRNEREIQELRFRQNDTDDKTKFLASVGKHAAFAGWAEKVEKELDRARREDRLNPTREAVLQFLLGREAMNNLVKGPAKKVQAKARVDAARGRPMGTQSDSSGSGNQRTASTAEKRLKDIRL